MCYKKMYSVGPSKRARIRSVRDMLRSNGIHQEFWRTLPDNKLNARINRIMAQGFNSNAEFSLPGWYASGVYEVMQNVENDRTLRQKRAQRRFRGVVRSCSALTKSHKNAVNRLYAPGGKEMVECQRRFDSLKNSRK